MLKLNATRVFLFVMLIAGLARAAVLWVQFDNLKQDPDAYRSIAECISDFRIYGQIDSTPTGKSSRPTAYRPPLYPLLLSVAGIGRSVSPLRIALLHWLLGLGTVALTWVLAERWAGRRMGIIGALLVTFDPLLLQQSTLVMTETTATFLAVTTLWASDRFSSRPTAARAALVGAITGSACLCRPTFIAFAVLVPIVMLLDKPRAKSVIHVVSFALTLALVMAPWTLRNWYVFGRPIAATTHGGYTLLLGNNPSFYRYLRTQRWGEVWNPADFHDAWSRRAFVRDPTQLWSSNEPQSKTALQRSEIEEDEFASAAALHIIQQQTATFLRSCVVRAYWLWRPLPQRLDESAQSWFARCLVGVWYVAVYAAAVSAVYLNRSTMIHSPWLWGLLLCLSVTAVHCLYWSNIRMRAPLMPFVGLLATAGITTPSRRRDHRKPLMASNLQLT